MEHGKLISLNGTLRSGKTAMALEFRQQLEDLHIRVSLDDMPHIFPKKTLHVSGILALEKMHTFVQGGMHWFAKAPPAGCCGRIGEVAACRQ